MSRQRSRSRVRFALHDEYEPEPQSQSQPQPRGRPQYSRPSPNSRENSYSLSRSRSRSRSQNREMELHRPQQPPRLPARPPAPATVSDHKKDKEWYNKKSLWTGLATVATVAALLPSSAPAKTSVNVAHTPTRATRARERSAQQMTKSARAGEASAIRSIMSERAVTRSSIAHGHIDKHGNGARRCTFERVESTHVTPIVSGGYSYRSSTTRSGMRF